MTPNDRAFALKAVIQYLVNSQEATADELAGLIAAAKDKSASVGKKVTEQETNATDKNFMRLNASPTVVRLRCL